MCAVGLSTKKTEKNLIGEEYMYTFQDGEGFIILVVSGRSGRICNDYN